LLYILKLGSAKTYDGIATGQAISKASITFTFSDANLTCDQIDEAYVNHKATKTLAITPVAAATNGTLKTTLSSSFTFSKNDN